MAQPENVNSTLNISPDVGVLSVLRHLKYKPWYALAEFVDNSIQSYLLCREHLESQEGHGFRLVVSIEFQTLDGGQIVIRDNAAGIASHDFPRAFRPASAPPNRNGLSEFGMGMKSAACWFANNWSVRTTALSETVERTIVFDVPKIVATNQHNVAVETQPASQESHYTELRLWNLHSLPQGRTLSKIKEHLTSIYRVFVRSGILELRFNDEVLTYEEPETLVAPFFKNPTASAMRWYKEIDFDFGQGQRAHGFAALRTTGSTSHAGFALFRRDRLIEGSGEETYRPGLIFGGSNSFTYQRLFGELHLEGFEVSHTKDGFRWDNHEEPFLELLREELDKTPLPLIQQAEGFRVRPKVEDWHKEAELATRRTAEVIHREVPPVIEAQVVRAIDPTPPPKQLPLASLTAFREIELPLRGCNWIIRLELACELSISEWLTVGDAKMHDTNGLVRHLNVRISLAHPFMEQFVGPSQNNLEPLVRVAAALGLAEVAARDAGVQQAGEIRRNLNELLRNALSKP